MSTFDLDEFENGMNLLYPKLSKQLEIRSNVFRAMDKEYKVVGDDILWRPFASASNGSKTWEESRAFRGAPQIKQARFPFKYDFVNIAIEIQLLMAATGNGSSKSAQEVITDGAIDEHALTQKLELLGNGVMMRGQISATSNVATPTITLANPEHSIFFLEDMYVQAAPDNTGVGALRTNRAQIGTIILQTGALSTKNGLAWNHASNIPDIQAGDWLCRTGDRNLGFHGLDSWFPRVAPVAPDTAFGGFRFTQPEKYSGMRVPVSGELLDAIFTVAGEMQLNGADIDGAQILLSARRAMQLCKTAQTQKVYMEERSDATKFGASSFQIRTPYGTLTAMSETGYDHDRFLIGPLNKYMLKCREASVPDWLDIDGRRWRHLGSNGFTVEACLHSMCGTLIETPKDFAQGIFPA